MDIIANIGIADVIVATLFLTKSLLLLVFSFVVSAKL